MISVRDPWAGRSAEVSAIARPLEVVREATAEHARVLRCGHGPVGPADRVLRWQMDETLRGMSRDCGPSASITCGWWEGWGHTRPSRLCRLARSARLADVHRTRPGGVLHFRGTPRNAFSALSHVKGRPDCSGRPLLAA